MRRTSVAFVAALTMAAGCSSEPTAAEPDRVPEAVNDATTPPAASESSCDADLGSTTFLTVRAWSRVISSREREDHGDYVDTFAEAHDDLGTAYEQACGATDELEAFDLAATLVTVGVLAETATEDNYAEVTAAGNALLETLSTHEGHEFIGPECTGDIGTSGCDDGTP